LFEAGEQSPYETIRITLVTPGAFVFLDGEDGTLDSGSTSDSTSSIAAAAKRSEINVLRDGHDGMAGAWG
jgi:hypothetical protein